MWHQLHTRDRARGWELYGERFGWTKTAIDDAPSVEDGHLSFAYAGSREAVGSMASTARLPGVHTHWLYYFRVPDLDDAALAVKANGGVVAAVATLPNGHRIAPCDDPQGAAFGLMQLA
ncbi:MAG: hypothetical protein JWP87_339 [Labilithrix sp.]|nr:hypothetical protein [Labilithrix sp.]